MENNFGFGSSASPSSSSSSTSSPSPQNNWAWRTQRNLTLIPPSRNLWSEARAMLLVNNDNNNTGFDYANQNMEQQKGGGLLKRKPVFMDEEDEYK